MIRPVALLAASLVCCFAQELTIKSQNVYMRGAWVLSNGLIRVSILPGGGHIAEVRLISSDPLKNVNPMRVPHYQTIDPDKFVEEKHAAVYGKDPHRWLSSGYMGHLLCFPFYGPPSSDWEVKAGLGNHGEAPIVRWREVGREITADAIVFRYEADLTRTQYKVERTITLPKGKRMVRVEEWVENLTNYDRPFQWMQHATFGPPFIEPGKTVLDASATRAQIGGQPEFQWPGDRRVMQAEPKTGSYTAMLMDPARKTQFFTMFHPRYRTLIGYVFPTETNRWLADWQENRRNTGLPWNGQVIARGMEFGNSPYAEGLRKAVDRGSLFGTPAYGWIGAHERKKTEYTIFLAEIAEGYQGTRDVILKDGEPALVAR